MEIVIALKIIVLLLASLLPGVVWSQTSNDELIECYTSTDCSSGPTTPLLMTRRQCCVDTPAAVGFKIDGSEVCSICIVFGFLQSTFSGMEQGPTYSVSVGFKKGRTVAPARLSLNVQVELGTATSRDITLHTISVDIDPSNSNPGEVFFTLRPDGITQEENETLIVRLSVAGASQSLLALYNFNNEAFFIDVLNVVIIDNDVLEITFDNDDYRASEPELSILVRVNKNQRIATPVTVRVTPSTLSQHRANGRPDPPDILVDNQFSPIEANFQDFDSSPVTATFQPDENGSQVDSILVPVAIMDDVINEAPEQNFVVTLSVETATNPENITVTGQDSLCRIRDNDDIRIGFEQPSYTYSEPEFFSVEIFDEVFIAKENNIISEQTFRILITATGNTPSPNIRAADHSTDASDNDYAISTINPSQGESPFIILLFEPQEQRVPFIFRLVNDDMAEGTEAFRASLSRDSDNSPAFSDPMVLTANTFIVIEDDDYVIIGFERNYTVNETAGMVQVCAVVLSPSPNVPILSRITLGVNTAAGTAGETDYTRIVANERLVVLRYDTNNRRRCFNVAITADGRIENTEKFTVHLVISPFESPSIPVLLNPNVTTIEILGDADVTVGFVHTDVSVVENGNAVVLSVGVLEGQLTGQVQLLLSTSSRTAQSGSDYEDVSNRPLTIELGSTSVDVSVNIFDDDVFELTEQFSATLTLQGTPVDRVAEEFENAEITILDNDGLTIGFNPATYSVNENAGATTLGISLLSGSLGQLGVSVLVTTSEGTADGSDFTSLQRHLVQMANDEQTASVVVNIIDDDVTEHDEQFSVEIVEVTVSDSTPGAITLTDQDRDRITLNPSLANVTIIDEDEVVIGFLETEYQVGEADGNVTFLIGVRSGELSFDVDVTFQTADDTAIDGDDYSSRTETLVFTGTETQQVTVNITNDDIMEADKSFLGQLSVSSSLPPRVSLNPASATVTITDKNFPSTDATPNDGQNSTSDQDGASGASNNNTIFIIVGVVVAIFITAVAVVIILIIITVVCLKKKNSKSRAPPPPPPAVPTTFSPSDQGGGYYDDVHLYEEMKGLHGDYAAAQRAYDNMETNDGSHDQILVENVAYGQLKSEKETTNQEISDYYVVPDP